MQVIVGTSEHPRKELQSAEWGQGNNQGLGEDTGERNQVCSWGGPIIVKLRPKGEEDQPSEGRTGKDIPGGRNCMCKGPVVGKALGRNSRAGRGEGDGAGLDRAGLHRPAGLREESSLDPRVKEKPLKGPGGEGHDQFTFRTFSGPRA